MMSANAAGTFVAPTIACWWCPVSRHASQKFSDQPYGEHGVTVPNILEE